MTKDTTGAVSFEAVVMGEVKKRQKALDAEYADAAKAYKAANDTTQPKPQQPRFMVLESRVTGKDSKQKAEALVARFQEQYEKKQSKKEGGETDTKDSATKPEAEKKS